MILQYEITTGKHLDEALALVTGAYRKERRALPILPPEEDLLPMKLSR